MKSFSELFTALDQTTKTNEKVAALERYFQLAPDEDKLWALALLSQRRPRRTVNATQMKSWTATLAGLPFWLVDESHHIAGDLAEAVALMLPQPSKSSDHSLTYWINYINKLRDVEEEEREKRMQDAWDMLDKTQRFVFNKLITGGFRMGVSQKLMVRALSKYTGIEENLLAHRLMGDWTPDTTTFEQLILSKDDNENLSRPYPFYLSYPLEADPETLGNPEEWQAEFKWDGIRGQLICRDGQLFVWSRGEELVTDKYPEYDVLTDYLPDGTVLDGEILPFKEGLPLPFTLLQKRIGRKKAGPSILAEVPVIFMAYDLLENEGRDVRNEPLSRRRKWLEEVTQKAPEVLRISETISFDSWKKLAGIRVDARSRCTEGVMLKRLDSVYQVGRKRGDWWKWKVDPLTVDAVMIYAMRGHGRRANLYTDYTFAVRDGDQLVPFAKAYSGLTDKEIARVDRFVKQNTLERFGPVRSVKPELVFEIAFEGINKSERHKSGVALRFPRIRRWREDKPVSEINTLGDLMQLMEQYG
jgi:DNA ligase-1